MTESSELQDNESSERDMAAVAARLAGLETGEIQDPFFAEWDRVARANGFTDGRLDYRPSPRGGMFAEIAYRKPVEGVAYGGSEGAGMYIVVEIWGDGRPNHGEVGWVVHALVTQQGHDATSRSRSAWHHEACSTLFPHSAIMETEAPADVWPKLLEGLRDEVERVQSVLTERQRVLALVRQDMESWLP